MQRSRSLERVVSGASRTHTDGRSETSAITTKLGTRKVHARDCKSTPSRVSLCRNHPTSGKTPFGHLDRRQSRMIGSASSQTDNALPRQAQLQALAKIRGLGQRDSAKRVARGVS